MNTRVRRHILLAPALLMIGLCSRSVGAQDVVAGQWVLVKTGPAAVLLDPSAASIVVGTVTTGTRLQVLEIRNGWYFVTLPKAPDERAARSGWLPAALTVPSGPPTAPTPPQAISEAPAPKQPLPGEAAGDAALESMLRDLHTQRDKLDRAIQALEGVADTETLRVRRDKLDRAIEVTQDLAREKVSSMPPPSRPVADSFTPRSSSQLTKPNPPAFYETPQFNISGSYSFLRDQEVEENGHGWLVSLAGNFNQWVGIAGEVGGNYKSFELLGTDVLNLSVHSFLGGPRFSARPTPHVTPFGQVLLGPVRVSMNLLGEKDSTTEFAIQPGGGVDFWLNRNVGIRVGGDYRRIFYDEEGGDEFRFHIGFLLGGGRQ